MISKIHIFILTWIMPIGVTRIIMNKFHPMTWQIDVMGKGEYFRLTDAKYENGAGILIRAESKHK